MIVGAKSIYIGTTAAKRVYLGNKLVFPNYNQRTQQVLNYASTQGYNIPSNIAAYDEFITTIESVLNKLDLFYLFGNDGDVNFRLLNIVDVTRYKGTAFGGLVWDKQGVTNSGLNGYIDTNFNPGLRVEGQKYQLNDASRGAVVINNQGTNTNTSAVDGIIGDASNCFFATNTNAHRINQAVSNNGSTGSQNAHFVGDGFKVISRDSSSEIDLTNDSGTIRVPSTSSSIREGNQVLMTRVTSLYSNLGLSMYFMGAALTAQDTNTLKNAFNVYKAKLMASNLSVYAKNNNIDQPSNQTALENFLMRSIKEVSKMDFFYSFLGNYSTPFKLINIIYPGRFNAVANGGMEWLPTGVNGNGMNAWMSTGFIPNDQPSAKYKLTDATIGYLCTKIAGDELATTNGNQKSMLGTDNVNTTMYNHNLGYIKINSTNKNIPSTDNTGTGLKTVSILGTDYYYTNKDRVVSATSTSTDRAMPTQVFTLHRISGGYGSGGLGFVFGGAALTRDEIQNLRSSMNQYMIDLGLTPLA